LAWRLGGKDTALKRNDAGGGDRLGIVRDKTDREFARFLGYALASTSELEYHFIVARDVRAITAADFSSTLSQLIDVRKMLHGLMSKLSSPKRTVPSP
jgi:hypothetical protein